MFDRVLLTIHPGECRVREFFVQRLAQMAAMAAMAAMAVVAVGLVGYLRRKRYLSTTGR